MHLRAVVGFLFVLKIRGKKMSAIFARLGTKKDCCRGIPEGGCAPLCLGGSKGA